MSAFINDDSSLLYGEDSSSDYNPQYAPVNPLYSTADLMPMYSALSSGDALRHYQQQNNQDEVIEGLTWSERLEAGATGMAHGLSSYGPEQIYQSLRTIGKIFGSDSLIQYATEGVDREKRMRELDPFYAVPENWATDGWGRSLYESMRGVSASAYAMLPGAAISLIPGGQAVGLASIGLGGGGVAGLAEYDSFIEDAVEQFQALNPSLSREDIEDNVFWDAVWSGVTEGGIEAATDIVGGKLIGLVGKAGVPQAKHIIDKLARNLVKTITLEAGGEVATAAVQDYLREHAGLDYQGRVAAMKNALGPALVGGAAFGLGGTALNIAQGKLGVLDASPEATAKHRAEFDQHVMDLRRKDMEAHYTPQAVNVFDSLTEGGADYIQASTMMEAVESTAKAWADRNNLDAASWRGDGGKVVDMVKRLEDRRANQDVAMPESLANLRDIATSELTVDQRQALADAYGVQPNGDTVIIDTDRLDTDLRRIIADPKSIANIPESARPALEAMRESALDMYGLTNRQGLAGGFDPELSMSMGKAIEYRNAGRPRPSAFVYQKANLDNVLRQYGDFSKLDAKGQTAMIQDLAKATDIDFAKWDMPTSQAALFGMIDNEMRPLLDKLMKRGERTNAKQESRAKATLEKQGINLERFAQFASELTGNGDLKESASVKAVEMAMAERIILAKVTELSDIANQTLAPADFVKRQAMAALYQQVHSMVRAVRSESSHLLRAWNWLKKDPSLERSRINQMFDAMGGLEMARHQLDAYNQAATDAARAEVLEQSLKAKTVNAILEYRTLNMLSNIKTQVVNTVGNGATLTTELWNRFLAEKMGMGQGVVKGETWAMMNGLWDGLLKVKQDWSAHKANQGGTIGALRNIGELAGVDPSSSLAGDAGLTQRSLTKDNALDIIGGAKEKMGLSKEHGMISNGLATMVDYMGRMLGISGDFLATQDYFFKTIAAHGETAARNHREALRQAGGDKAKYKRLVEHFKEHTPSAHKEAGLEFGKFVTFQTDLQGFAKSLNQMRQKQPLLRGLVPFFKTPVNIMRYAAAHTPGVASLFADIRGELNSPDVAVRHLAEARVMTGTFVWATAIGLAASGYLTGSGPTDDNEREKARATGWQPNSLRIPGKDGQPDTYVALDRLDPAAFILNTAASLVEIYDSLDGDDLDKAMWGGMAAAFRVASDRTYLRSLADAVAAVNDWEGYEGDRARQGIFTSMIPGSSMLRSVTQQLDPVQREVRGIFDAIRAGVPGFSEALPVRRNFLGEEIKSDGYIGSDWLSPLRQSRDKKDPVYDEIYRLARGGHKIPSMPSHIMHHQGRAVKMDGEQYSQFLELAGVGLKYGGKNAKEKIAEVIASPAYRNWTDENKTKRIQAIIEGYRAEARKTIKAISPEWRDLLGIGK